MFILRTGLQGNGKTLNTIKEVDQKAFAEKRTVYYCNVTGFNAAHPAIKAEWIPFDYPERWFELPANSMIVIDEAQTWFRTRPQGSKVPDYASRLEIMRKDGHELHCITQSPKLIDSHMRELCNMHVHYHRGNGGSIIKRWVFQKPELGVNSSKLTFENGESSRITIDKDYFGCYESVKEGSEHHFKFRPPKALILLIVCLVVISALSYRFYTHRIAPTVQPESAPGAIDPALPASFVSGSGPMTVDQYVQANLPRLPDVPSSAPIFDQVAQVVSYPRAFCVSSHDQALIKRAPARMTLGYVGDQLTGCRCNSQQGTKIDMSFDACIARVDYGAFDPARPDAVALPVGSDKPLPDGPGEERAGTPGSGAQLTVVQSGKPGLLW